MNDLQDTDKNITTQKFQAIDLYSYINICCPLSSSLRERSGTVNINLYMLTNIFSYKNGTTLLYKVLMQC